jgi:uncharacterized short protein YbdD (DUF466 family)
MSRWLPSPVELSRWAGARWRIGVQLARRMIGVPDYEVYLDHLRSHHPERVPMSYAQFFEERQQARYRGGGGRCC